MIENCHCPLNGRFLSTLVLVLLQTHKLSTDMMVLTVTIARHMFSIPMMIMFLKYYFSLGMK